MSILIDTNVVLRSVELMHPQHAAADQVVQRLIHRKELLVMVPQVLYEFWAVATRSLNNNGLGLTTAVAAGEITKLEHFFTVLDDEKGILARWKELVLQFDVKGKPAHDARLVAAMEVHGISSLLTFNKSDFVRYKTINILTPEEVLAI
jgi:predicted nucleic acid-binding protein